MVFGLFRTAPAKKPVDEILNIPWEMNPSGRFWRLMYVRTDRHNLNGRGGVLAVFHRGVRPAWVYVGATLDLGKLIEDAKDDPQISEFDNRGGLFATWSFVKPSYQEGVVAYLRQQLKPKVLDSPLDMGRTYSVKPIRVHPPV